MSESGKKRRSSIRGHSAVYFGEYATLCDRRERNNSDRGLVCGRSQNFGKSHFPSSSHLKIQRAQGSEKQERIVGGQVGLHIPKSDWEGSESIPRVSTSAEVICS